MGLLIVINVVVYIYILDYDNYNIYNSGVSLISENVIVYFYNLYFDIILIFIYNFIMICLIDTVVMVV